MNPRKNDAIPASVLVVQMSLRWNADIELSNYNTFGQHTPRSAQ